MIGIDFNLPIKLDQDTFTDFLKGSVNARRQDDFLTTVRLSTQEAVRQMCSPVSRQPSDKIFFLLRSISLYGFCTNNLSPEPPGYRKLPSCNAVKTLSLRHKRECFPNHDSKGKRESSLENLRGLRRGFNNKSQNTLCRRRLRHSTESRGLCAGFNNHRFMYVSVSMGKISQTQSGNQSTHADGLKRLNTHIYPHYRRKSPRCKFPQRANFRARGDICYGSRIPRLRSSLYVHSKPFNFCYKSQNQFRLSPDCLSPGRQNYRFAKRPNDKTQRLLRFTGLSCRTEANQLLRHRDKQKIRILNKQLYSAGFDNCSTLQVPLANRNIFQMDQAISENQNIFRHQYQCRENSNLDSHKHLYSCGNCKERIENRAEYGRNTANSQHCTFRASADRTSTYE